MSNNTELISSTDSYSDIPLPLVIFVRINAAVILVENLIVALCLYTHRRRNYREEFWLQLVCLNVSDMFCGVAMILFSLINYDTINKTSWGCIGLWLSVLISQLASMYNLLVICVYRFVSMICSLRFRFGCKTKMAILQLIFVYLFCTTYCIIPVAMWANKNRTINDCTSEDMFSNKKEQSMVFFAGGYFVPLIFLNVLYFVTFCKLRRNWERGNQYAWNFNVPKTKTTGVISNCKVRTERSNIRKLKDRSATSDVTSACGVDYSCFIEGAEQMDLNLEINHDFHPCSQSPYGSERQSCKGPKQEEQPSLEIRKFRRNSFKVSDQSDSIQQTEQKEVPSVNTETEHLSVRNMRNDSVIEFESQARRNNFYRGYNRNIQRQSLVLIGIIMLLIDITVFLPILINTLAHMLLLQKSKALTVIFIAIILNNALINPWVYSFQSKPFRSALKDNISKICKGFCCRNNR